MENKRVTFTPDQLRAIENEGGELLVSAAAGSGKTRVLVERLLRQVMQGRADIDDFLVITFTEAAASELRGKIIDEISERLAADPMNRALRRQLSLCYKADIGTIHAFCGRLVRENAHMLGIAPDFRIADETELASMKQVALERLLDSRYEEIAEHPNFPLLADTMGAGRDDRRLEEAVLRLYEAVMSHPYPVKWLSEQRGRLALEGVCELGGTPWGRYLLDRALSSVGYWRRQLEKLISDAESSPDFLEAYGGGLAEQIENARALETAIAKGWDETRKLSDVPMCKVRSIKGYDELKAARNRCIKGIRKAASIFSASSAELLCDMRAVAPAADEILMLTADFEKAFTEEKRRRSVADFNDLEHLAVRLLVDEKTGARTPLSLEIAAGFREVMIDEYQDVNAVQELIFRAVSRENAENLFMVGDVKQSIYRFRLADPTIFLGKYFSLSDPETAAAGEGRRVILSKNFRSRSGVLDAVNYVFKNIMSTEFGEMDYTPSEYLYPGAEYPESDEPETELYVIDRPDGEDAPEKGEIEAEFIAERIERLLKEGKVSDGEGGLRHVRPGDIAILLRSPKGRQQRYAQALGERGIPCYTGGNAGFFKTVEISVMTSLLSVIDNPRQDIPLISVMRSPVFGFTADELADVRLADRSADFWTALKKSAETNEKCARFAEEIENCRTLAPDMPVDGLVWHLFSRTGILGIMSAMPGGAERYDNLMLLFDLAGRFEHSGNRGLYAFVNHLRRMEKDGREPEREEPGVENAVLVRSIHKSKGLEYPVVFLADTTKEFNLRDTKERLLIHPELGVGVYRVDLERKIEYQTAAHKAIARKIREESLAEELRLLYVAMTRAREKLIITCAYPTKAYPSAEAALAAYRRDSTLPVDPQVLGGAKSMADWLMLAAVQLPEAGVLRDDMCPFKAEGCGKPWHIEIIKQTDRAGKTASAKAEAKAPDREKVAEIAEKIAFQYPHGEASGIPSKLTATEARGFYGSTEAAENAEKTAAARRSAETARPDFIGKERLTGADRGNALHTVMERIDLGKCSSVGEIRSEIARIEASGAITHEQAASVDAEAIYGFFRSDTGRRLLGADEVKREFKFLLLVPAREFYPDGGDDGILLQGVVDCCIEKNGELTIIDYKTDYVDEINLQAKTDLYRGQLKVYERAMSEITGKKVVRKIIYFFSKGAEVEV